MNKNVLWSLIVVVFSVTYVSSQIIIPIIHPSIGGRETNCSLSQNATNDYYDIRDFIFAFLEVAETDFRRMSDDDKRMSCQYSKGNLSILVERGKKDWSNCLTDNYQYLGGFVNDTLQYFLDFFCEDNDHIEGYFSEEAKQCREDIKKPLFDNCLNELLGTKNKNMDYNLSFKTFTIPGKRDNLCRKILDIGPCTADILAIHCPHLDYYSELSAKLFAEVAKPCDEYVTYISAARVVGWTLFIISVCIILVVRFCPVRKWYEDLRHRAASKTFTNSVM